MPKTTVPCPLGEHCPYAKGNKVPNHYTTSATYKLHEELAKKSSESGTSPDKVVQDFYAEKNNWTESNISDAKIRSDGTISFSGIGKGKEWFEAQKDINKAMTNEIKAGTASILIDPDKLARFTHFVASNYTLSYNNLRLVNMQSKIGSVFRTEAQWKEDGYELTPGVRQAMVRRPLFRKRDKKDDQGNVILGKDGKPEKEMYPFGFKFYGVYSDRDLNPDVKAPPMHPLHEHFQRNKNRTDITAPAALKEDITKVADSLGIGINYVSKNEKSTLASGAAGYATQENGKYQIYIDNTMQEHAQVSTLAHELGHVMCGHLSDDNTKHLHRGDKEAQAEIFSYALTKDYDFDTSEETFAYLKSWVGDKGSKIDDAFEEVSKVMGKYYARLQKAETGTDQHEEMKAINQEISKRYKEKSPKRKARRKK